MNEKGKQQNEVFFGAPSPTNKHLPLRSIQSQGPRLQAGTVKGLLREPSLNCFQIDMHEYGLPSIYSGSDLQGDRNYMLEDNNMDEFGMLLGGISSGKQISPLVKFDPIEYGSLQSKYKGDKLIFSEIMSSTKIYLTKNIQTEENVVKKIIQKDKLFNQLSHEFAKRECSVHSQMSHENIIKLYEYSETPQEYQLFMEYADQTDYLCRKILDQLTPIKNEDKLKYWVQNVLEALHYIHIQGIVHVDLKLENVLINTSEVADEYPMAKLCDFGLCHLLEEKVGKSFMEVRCGTQGYTAPEQKDQSWVGTEIDMWSFGILLYELAVAYKPTSIKNYRYNPSDDVPFWNPDWKKRDKQLQDLIKQCLKYEPSKRISAQDALQHTWLNE